MLCVIKEKTEMAEYSIVIKMPSLSYLNCILCILLNGFQLVSLFY